MNEQLVAQLEEMGLSNKEARVYVANLMLGPAGVQQIADTSGIKRVTTYVILEALANLGLVSQTSQGRKTLFNAEAPENLRRLIEKREELLKEQKTKLDELVPDLKSLRASPRDTPAVKFYDGHESIMTIYKVLPDVFRKYKVKESLAITNLDLLYKFFPEIDYAKANPSRLAAGISSRTIYTMKEGPGLQGIDKSKMRESRYIPPEKFAFSSDISIVGGFVVLLSLTEPRPMGITIESKKLADDFRTIFNLAWEGSKK